MPGPKLMLIPIGEVPQEILTWLRDALAGHGWSATIGPGVAIPPQAWNAQRGQLQGDALLAALRKAGQPSAHRLLGVVDADCYAPGLNFIFGQASLPGREAFIVLPRLRPSFYGLPMDDALYKERTLKEAVHELGHSMGLPHCPYPLCVMHFSNALAHTDRKKARYCSRCRALLERLQEGENGR
jgi:archaemetzincin